MVVVHHQDVTSALHDVVCILIPICYLFIGMESGSVVYERSILVHFDG